MSVPHTKLAVFDCDGTLVDGQADVCIAMEQAFAESGFAAPDPNEVRRMVGLSLPNAIRRLQPDADDSAVESATGHYKRIFRARRESGVLSEPLYDGIKELLNRLHDNGWLLAVATGKSQRGLNACLEAHGISDLFTSLQAADGHPSKPHPAMLEAALFEAGVEAGKAVMIGDTSFDMIMAKDAGVRALGVAWGYHTPDELIETGAEAVARDIAHLEEIL
jgi:phosphoglycolate phosphatase